MEIFSLLNRLNLSGPDACLCSGSGMGLIYGTIHAGDAPGIGSGEPRNAQLALKILW